VTDLYTRSLRTFLEEGSGRRPDVVSPLIVDGINYLAGGVGEGKTLLACELALTKVTGLSRLGFASGRTAFYGLVGPSWQNVEIHYVCPATASWCLSARETRRSDARFGWVAGAGMEWRFDPRWSTRLDFRYAKYKDMDYSFFAESPEAVHATVSLQTTTLNLGVSYHF